MVKTNYEHYHDTIEKILLNGDSLALTNDGKLRGCHGLECGECQFFIRCQENRRNWLTSEFKEPKPKLTPADHNLVSLLKNGYIARDENGKLWFYNVKPKKIGTAWYKDSIGSFTTRLDHTGEFAYSDFLSFIKWEDAEPWSIEDLLKLEVMKCS